MTGRKTLPQTAARQALARTAHMVASSGLTPVLSGNISVRHDDGFFVTPSGLAFAGLRPQDMVWIGPEGPDGRARKPSSEWIMHQMIYQRRSDCGAIVHTHSPFATALACAHREIPPFHYMVAVTGAERVPVARYATFGTDALARNVVDALGAAGLAALIANHGAIALGRSLEHAYRLAWEVETLAAQFLRASQAGMPRILDRAEMARVMARFAAYGQDEGDDLPRAAE